MADNDSDKCGNLSDGVVVFGVIAHNFCLISHAAMIIYAIKSYWCNKSHPSYTSIDRKFIYAYFLVLTLYSIADICLVISCMEFAFMKCPAQRFDSDLFETPIRIFTQTFLLGYNLMFLLYVKRLINRFDTRVDTSNALGSPSGVSLSKTGVSETGKKRLYGAIILLYILYINTIIFDVFFTFGGTIYTISLLLWYLTYIICFISVVIMFVKKLVIFSKAFIAVPTGASSPQSVNDDNSNNNNNNSDEEKQRNEFDLIARILLCCSVAVTTSILTTVLTAAARAFDSVDFVFLLYCVINLDVFCNSLCLTLQWNEWNFSNVLYYNLCKCCDTKVKNCCCLRGIRNDQNSEQMAGDVLTIGSDENDD